MSGGGGIIPPEFWKRQPRFPMRKLLVLIIIGFAAFTTHADDAAPAPSFTTLKEALAFIDHELDVEDWAGLTHALFPAAPPNETERNNFSQLKSERGNVRLADAFADKHFPDSGDTFAIPGSLMVPSWVGIKFIKSGNKWYINGVHGVR